MVLPSQSEVLPDVGSGAVLSGQKHHAFDKKRSEEGE